MLIEVKQWPDSQEVMGKPKWFFVMGTADYGNPLGDSAYGRILDESEYILVEKTTADEFNKEWLKTKHICPKCESIHSVHTINDLSDGNWHEVKDGSTTIIPDPFKEK